MIVSSLVSLDTVLEMENPGYTITKVPPAIVNDKSLANIIDTIQPTASLILTNGKQIFGLHKVHKLVEIQQQFINDSLTELNPASYTGNARDYITYLALVQAVITKMMTSFGNLPTRKQMSSWLFHHSLCSIYWVEVKSISHSLVSKKYANTTERIRMTNYSKSISRACRTNTYQLTSNFITTRIARTRKASHSPKELLLKITPNLSLTYSSINTG